MAIITTRRSTLRLVSVAVGLLFTVGIYYTMHYRMGWDWEARGLGKLPQVVVEEFLDEAYAQGKGADARRHYFAPELGDDAARPQEIANGAPIARETHRTVAQGLTVTVFHSIAPARGEPETDAIDVFEVRNGRIVQRDLYATDFGKKVTADAVARE